MPTGVKRTVLASIGTAPRTQIGRHLVTLCAGSKAAYSGAIRVYRTLLRIARDRRILTHNFSVI